MKSSRVLRVVEIGGSPNGWKASWVGLGASIVVVVMIGPLATPAGAAFSAPIKLSPPDVKGAHATIDANGDAIAVWSGYDGAKWRVQERQISATGSRGRVKTISAAGDKSLSPQIAGNPDGGAIVVWTRTHGTSKRVQARRISANGRLGPVKTISSPRRTATSPRIASDARGDARAVWLQHHRRELRVKTRKISSTGALGPVKTLSSARQKSHDPVIASDADGDVIAAWSQPDSEDWRIRARRISANGRLGSVKTLSAPGHGAGLTQVASDARGNALVVWSQFNSQVSNRSIKARRISATGALGPRLSLSDAGEYALSPKVASNASGEAIVVWYGESDGDSSSVEARRISPSGALGPRQTVASSGYNYPGQPAIDSAGKATAIWGEHVYPTTSPEQSYLQTREISATGALGPTQTLAAAHVEGPQATVNAEGNAFAVWSQFDGSHWSAWGSLGP
jgi:hypothetical protein